MGARAPNILFLMSDQMGAPVLPIHGHPVCQAPHIEALADSGVVFDSAYCNSSFAIRADPPAGGSAAPSPMSTCCPRWRVQGRPWSMRPPLQSRQCDAHPKMS